MVTRGHLNTAKAQKGQYLLPLPQISHVILQNECAIGAVLVFPIPPCAAEASRVIWWSLSFRIEMKPHGSGVRTELQFLPRPCQDSNG